jgi:hypothetical protein
MGSLQCQNRWLLDQSKGNLLFISKTHIK